MRNSSSGIWGVAWANLFARVSSAIGMRASARNPNATAKSRRARSPAKKRWAITTFFPFASSSRSSRLRGRIPHGRSFGRRPMAALLMLPLAVAGCTVHPSGETEERQAALEAGRPFADPVERRDIPELPEHPTSDDLVQRALLSNPDLEQ